ncbi:unnamed protein product [Pleuronectes platessa]|uniref:Uncharacterized protein n=1 Tax=Pleuronectes platessa TaxID=8262 RepID=A0A9N7V206_PLEPL|nr:unnamed protein product [Pleuronectes platessa]
MVPFSLSTVGQRRGPTHAWAVGLSKSLRRWGEEFTWWGGRPVIAAGPRDANGSADKSSGGRSVGRSPRCALLRLLLLLLLHAAHPQSLRCLSGSCQPATRQTSRSE